MQRKTMAAIVRDAGAEAMRVEVQEHADCAAHRRRVAVPAVADAAQCAQSPVIAGIAEARAVPLGTRTGPPRIQVRVEAALIFRVDPALCPPRARGVYSERQRN